MKVAPRGNGRTLCAQSVPTTGAWSMKKAQVLCATVALTWAFVWSRLSESNRRPIHYERRRGLVSLALVGDSRVNRTNRKRPRGPDLAAVRPECGHVQGSDADLASGPLVRWFPGSRVTGGRCRQQMARLGSGVDAGLVGEELSLIHI